MTFRTIQQAFFFGLLIIITIAFLWVIRDFVFAIFWAVVLGIIFYPVQAWWLKRTKNKKSISSLATLLTIFILIFVPIFIVGSFAVAESIGYYQQFSNQQSAGSGISILDQIVASSEKLEVFGIEQEEVRDIVFQGAQAFGDWLSSQVVSFGQNTFRFFILFFVMIYILFFILRDGERLEKRILEILPLGDAKEKRLITRFVSTVRATVKGTFVIAAIQGTIGGVLFAIAGISAPVLWATLMGLLSVIPAVGPAVIWLPAGLILLFTGNVWQGIVVLIGGAIVISLVDNLLRPPLIGKDTQMPDVVILLSTLGGLTLFGITGFVIGPIIAAFFLAMWHMFEEEYRDDLKLHG